MKHGGTTILGAFDNPSETTPDFLFWCPGCKHGHTVWVTHGSPHPRSLGAKWTFNGNMEKPTFSPSYRIPKEQFDDKGEFVKEIGTLCHLHVEDGLLKYCDDCEHDLKGQTVPMEPF